MRTLSTGKPSTLKTYYDIAIALFGKNSKLAQFFADKAAEQGWDQEVMQAESQIMYLILELGLKGAQDDQPR